MRFALSFAPKPDTDFARLADAWLGRDAYTAEPVEQPAIAGFTAEEFSGITADPRRYGFHGTLKAPFKLADGATEANLIAELESFAALREPVPAGDMKADTLHGFVALVPAGEADALGGFADEVVRHFDRFRAPLTPEDRARRNPSAMSERQRENLDRWGYPYIFEDFGFHLTLSRRLDPERADMLRARAANHFASVLEAPLFVDALTLFIEKAPGLPFTVLQRFPFPAANA